MEILKKIIISNNKRPILLNTDSRNDNSLSKTNQTSKTNYINNKSSYVNIQNSKIKLRKNIPMSKMNISFSKKNNCNNNKNELSKECKLISYIDLGNNKNKKYKKIKQDISHDSKHNYTLKKDLIINNNITNNISNHITNIILTNNNNNNKSHIVRKYPNNLKKSNRIENKNYIFTSKTKNNNNINESHLNESNNNNLSQQLRKKKRIIKNNLLIERYSYNCSKNIKNDLTSRNNNSIKTKFQNIKSKEKENKTKNITERNKSDIRTYFTSYINSSSNLNINKNNANIPINKNNIINKKNLYKYKNITNNIELNLNTKKLKQTSLKKLKEYQTYNSNSKKNLIKFTPSVKYPEDSLSINSINSKRNKISDKNNIMNNINYQQYIKTNRNTNNNNSFLTKIQKQYKPSLNININDIKNLNQMRSLFDKRITSANTNKSFGERNYNNISYINSSITIKGNFKPNLFNKLNHTLLGSESKSISKRNSKNKTKENNIFKYKNKNDIINNLYKNYKTDRSLSNYNKENNTNDDNSNINIINIINNFNHKNISYNKSFLVNNTDILKNKTLKGQKRKISLNIYKNIKKYFLSKSLQKAKNFDISNTYINYKSDNYNSYKEQYLYNKANSYRNISYVSKEKDLSKNYTKQKKPKYYSNQKKIHNKKIIINKKKNRCKKGNVECTEFNIRKNDLINLINTKNNNNIIKKKLLRRNPKSIQNYSKAAYTMTKNKNENKISEINYSRETYNSIPMNVLKNIFSINSEHFSPKPNMKNNLMKSYNININNIPVVQGGNIKQNKSFKISNPYHNITSLTKKKKMKIEDIINTKNIKESNINNKIKNKEDKLIKDNQESKMKENNSILENKENKGIIEEKPINIKNEINSKSIDKVYNIKHFHKSKTNQNFINSNINKYELEIKKPINEENIELKNQIITPINKNNNPQYLYEYIFDILQNLLLDESLYISNNYINPNYLFSYNEDTELTPEIRTVSINWLIMIIYKIFKFKENTLFLTVQIIDRFLSKKMLLVERTELLILCSLILSSKHEEIDYVNMVESLQLSSNKFTKEEIINMQYEILNELNFELIVPTMNDYYNIYCTILNLNEMEINKGTYLLNIILVDYNIIKYPNFIISLAAVKLIYNKNINNIIKRLRYYFIKNKQDKFLEIINDEKLLDKVCHKIKKIYKNYTINKHANIEEKFSDEKYNSVSTKFSSDLIDISDI